jgi:hypothetical protein
MPRLKYLLCNIRNSNGPGLNHIFSVGSYLLPGGPTINEALEPNPKPSDISEYSFTYTSLVRNVDALNGARISSFCTVINYGHSRPREALMNGMELNWL